jgi:hypothetical protein
MTGLPFIHVGFVGALRRLDFVGIASRLAWFAGTASVSMKSRLKRWRLGRFLWKRQRGAFRRTSGRSGEKSSSTIRFTAEPETFTLLFRFVRWSSAAPTGGRGRSVRLGRSSSIFLRGVRRPRRRPSSLQAGSPPSRTTRIERRFPCRTGRLASGSCSLKARGRSRHENAVQVGVEHW